MKLTEKPKKRDCCETKQMKKTNKKQQLSMNIITTKQVQYVYEAAPSR